MIKMKFIIVMFLGVLMTGCSTSKIDGLAVGQVSNTECQEMSRTRVDWDASSGLIKLILTREGDNIIGELRNYRVNCSHKDLIVNCKQDGSELTITVKEEEPRGNNDVISSNCSCPVNIYFTIYDIEGDLFHVNLDWRDFGNVSIKDGDTVVLMDISFIDTIPGDTIPSIENRELSLFLESEFRSFSDNIPSNAFYDESNIDECLYRIDSEEQLKALYKGEKSFPAIDFKDKTLIVGSLPIPAQLTEHYANLNLSKSVGGYFLNLFFTPSTHLESDNNTHFFFWGLYPKLESDSITINLWEGYHIVKIIRP